MLLIQKQINKQKTQMMGITSNKSIDLQMYKKLNK